MEQPRNTVDDWTSLKSAAILSISIGYQSNIQISINILQWPSDTHKVKLAPDFELRQDFSVHGQQICPRTTGNAWQDTTKSAPSSLAFLIQCMPGRKRLGITGPDWRVSFGNWIEGGMQCPFHIAFLLFYAYSRVDSGESKWKKETMAKSPTNIYKCHHYQLKPKSVQCMYVI